MTTPIPIRENEKAALLAMASANKPKEDTPKDDFNIVHNMPLPEGFVNPPCGEDGHHCVDKAGNYNKEWWALLIERIYDRQTNPQAFPLAGVTYLVPLDEWCDVPACVIESLKSAVETHHEYNASPEMVMLGKHPEHKITERKRFVYRAIRSA